MVTRLGRFFSRSRASWAEPGRHGPRIALVGDAQARAVAECVRILAPDARVRFIPAEALGDRSRGNRDALAACDHLFAQPLPAGDGADALPERARFFPRIMFAAFHPDAVRIAGRGGAVLSSIGPDHSAIVLFGHRRGLPPERIAGLFREDVFARLGYLDAWDESAAALIASGRAAGFDLAGDLLRWSRRGVFMHGIDRPRLSVLGDIAARLLAEAGLVPQRAPVEAYAPDPFLDGPVWPVYPALAALYGARGLLAFKRAGRSALLGLDAFVAESLALYRTCPREVLACERIERWERSPGIGTLFDEA